MWIFIVLDFQSSIISNMSVLYLLRKTWSQCRLVSLFVKFDKRFHFDYQHNFYDGHMLHGSEDYGMWMAYQRLRFMLGDLFSLLSIRLSEQRRLPIWWASSYGVGLVHSSLPEQLRLSGYSLQSWPTGSASWMTGYHPLSLRIIELPFSMVLVIPGRVYVCPVSAVLRCCWFWLLTAIHAPVDSSASVCLQPLFQLWRSPDPM